MAKSAYDAALILSVISGPDRLDPKSTPSWLMLIFALEIPEKNPTDYTQFTKHATFRGLRLGVPRTLFFDEVDHPEIGDAVDAAIRKIESLGATIRDPVMLPSTEELKDPPSLDIVLSTSLHRPLSNSRH